ncbi:hypothetical protein HBDW_04840 [Herbaspirillum sp. DW155]|uniref:GtrA family protein n=1 Tax=Herbaspirillum sp. DW155 TaxID=3095609 RepID=UPI00308D6A50|nr:hypothetical protein HBDW_04840 [Herbaspirillum sp. DW155]
MQNKVAEFKTLVRFGVTGVLVTTTAYVLYLIAFSFTGNDFASVLVSYILAIPLSFHLNCKFVFHKEYALKSFGQFAAMQLAAMLLNYAILHQLNAYCPRYVSALLSYGLVPVIVFGVSRLVIFKK